MFKIISTLLMVSSILVANVDFDSLDEIGESTNNESQVQEELKAFEDSFDNSVDTDKVEPAAGFEEMDKSFENEDKE